MRSACACWPACGIRRADAEAEGIAQPPEIRQLRKRTNLDGVHLSSEGLKPSLSPSHAPALVLRTHGRALTVEAACHEWYLTLRRAMAASAPFHARYTKSRNPRKSAKMLGIT